MSTETQAYDGITEEEQAALAELQEQLNDDDGEVFDPEKVHQEALQQEEQEQQAAKTPEEEQADADAKAKADAEAAEAASQQQEQQPTQAEPKAQATPYLVAEAPEDAEAKLADIGTKKDELAKKFDDGDVTTAEYQAELDKLNREERIIERQIDRAQLAAELEEQRAIAEREKAINTFLAGVNIPRDPKSLRFQVLDAAVRIVANDEANANLSYAETMQKAYDLCVEEGTLQAKSGAPQAKKGEPQAQQPKPAAKEPINAPPSLAHMPAAEATDTGENRFAWLAAIRDPDKHEAAFNKLSAADQEAYLATGG